MGARLLIQGIDFTDVTDGLEDLVITYDMGEGKLMGVSVSNELRLTSRGHNYLHGVFFGNPCEGKFARLAANIIFDCCDEGQSLSFIIDYEGIKVNDLDCETIINLKALSDLQLCYEYMRDTPYFFNRFASNYNSPKVWYSIQRKNFWLLVWLMGVLFPWLVLLEILEGVVNLILNILKFILNVIRRIFNFNNNDFIRRLNEWNYDLPSLDNYLRYLTGSGHYHFAPYIRDIFDHNINKANEIGGCTITLDFELLESTPYSELALFQAFSKGYQCTNLNPTFNRLAAYNRTLIQLLEELETVFRLRSGITPSGQFIIATENRFHAKAEKIFNAEEKFAQGFAEESPTYKFVQKNLIRISSISYTEDAIDIESKYKLEPEYADDKIWGQFTGADRHEVKFPFAPARFMYDSESAEIDVWYDDDRIRDDLRAGKNLGALIPLSGFNSWGVQCALPRDRDLLLSEHVCELPKLLVLQPGTSVNDAKVLRREIDRDGITNSGNTKFFKYNYPMHLEYDAGYNELMKQFHDVENPLAFKDRIIEMEDFTVALDGDMITAIRDNGLFVGVECKYGKAVPEQIEIRLSDCTATFKGLKYTCI